ncbi:MAG: GNAT family N-acetyltransferase [Chitinivibrionia bacterium]|nr:GNAT family N-acetyltransferase [Chitinivibrionia bacterium]
MEKFTQTIPDKTAEQIARIQREVLFEKSDVNSVKSLAESGVLFFVEFDEKQNVACFCSVKPILDEWEIYDLATVPEHRNRGMAKKIIGEILDFALKNGAKKVFLEVRESNNAAINLYSNLGFEKYLTRKNYYKNTQDGVLGAENAVCMRKVL